MTNRTADTSLLIYAKVAGFMYLFIIITSLLIGIFIDAELIVPGNDAATFNNIMANELLFRIGIASGLIVGASIVVLALALYVILKPVNKNLALLALLWRLAEAILGVVTVLIGFIVLLLLDVTVFTTEQLQALVGLFLDVRTAGIFIVTIFVSLGTIVFFYLFFKSRYIPRILAAWGIFSFSLALLYSFVNILFLPVAMIEFVYLIPGALFEVLIGLWLLIKGVNVEQWEKRFLESI